MSSVTSVSCSQTGPNYRELLLSSAARFQEEDEKHAEEMDSLKTKIENVGEHLQKQFGLVRTKMNYLYEEDLTVISDSEGELRSMSSSGLSTTSTMTTSAASETPQETSKMVQELIVRLTSLPPEERQSVFEGLMRELKKLTGEMTPSEQPVETPKVEKSKREAKSDTTPQLANGEIEATAPGPSQELGAKDSFITAQMLAEPPVAPLETKPSTTTPPLMKTSEKASLHSAAVSTT